MNHAAYCAIYAYYYKKICPKLTSGKILDFKSQFSFLLEINLC